METKKNTFFKTYIYPVILAFLGAYLKDNFGSVSTYFKDSKNFFLSLLAYNFTLLDVIIILCFYWLTLFLYNKFSSQYSKKEKIMLKNIERAPLEFEIPSKSGKHILFKYNLAIDNEEYIVENLTPYCLKCGSIPIKMEDSLYGDFKCRCNQEAEYNLITNVKNTIISILESEEEKFK